MSTLTNSIVRGFGFTIGRRAATSLLDTPPKIKNLPDNNMCWSHEGYVEGDPHCVFEHRKKTDIYRGVNLLFLIITSSIPYLGTLIMLSYIRYTFFKKFQINWYILKWKTFQFSDRRYSSGIREEKRLLPEWERSEYDMTVNYTKMKVIWFILFFWSIVVVNLIK